MIVYVESNFVLELALEQTEARAATTILDLAEAGVLELVIPNFSLSEPFTTVGQYRSQTNAVVELLQNQINHLQRSARHRSLVSSLVTARTLLAQIADEDLDLLEDTVERLLTTVEIAELNAEVFKQARRYETRYDLTPKDAVIYATIVADLGRQPTSVPKCFTSRDAAAFLGAEIKAELRSYNCRVITHFDQALLYMQSAVAEVQ